MTQSFCSELLSCDKVGHVVGAHHWSRDSKRKARDTRSEALAGPSYAPVVSHLRRQFISRGFAGAQDKRPPLGRSSSTCQPLILCGAVEDDSSRFLTTPIFPLNVVALPAATVPLQIFEARYRVLFSTLLSGLEGIDKELIQQDSPFLGTRRFGMCFTSQEGMAKVGTLLEIQQHLPLEDGRMLITSKGVERFQILRIVQERPVLVCEVEILKDQPGEDEKLVLELADEVADLFRSALQLSYKLKNGQTRQKVKDEQLEPEELSELKACDLSFWIASMFTDSQQQQQSLLEESSVIQRLMREKEILGGTVKYLSAVSALDTAFTDPEAGGSTQESAGTD